MSTRAPLFAQYHVGLIPPPTSAMDASFYATNLFNQSLFAHRDHAAWHTVLKEAYYLLVHELKPEILWDLFNTNQKLKASVIHNDLILQQQDKYTLTHLLYAYAQLMGSVRPSVEDANKLHLAIDAMHVVLVSPGSMICWHNMAFYTPTTQYVVWSCLQQFDITNLWRALPNHVYQHKRALRALQASPVPSFGDVICVCANSPENSLLPGQQAQIVDHHMTLLNTLVAAHIKTMSDHANIFPVELNQSPVVMGGRPVVYAEGHPLVPAPNRFAPLTRGIIESTLNSSEQRISSELWTTHLSQLLVETSMEKLVSANDWITTGFCIKDAKDTFYNSYDAATIDQWLTGLSQEDLTKMDILINVYAKTLTMGHRVVALLVDDLKIRKVKSSAVVVAASNPDASPMQEAPIVPSVQPIVAVVPSVAAVTLPSHPPTHETVSDKDGNCIVCQQQQQQTPPAAPSGMPAHPPSPAL